MFLAGDPGLSEVSKRGHEGQQFGSEIQECTALLKEETSYMCLASVFATGWGSALASVTVVLRNQTFFTDVCAEHHSGGTVPSL